MQNFAQISLLKKYEQKSNAFLTDLDMDTGAYGSNWSVFYTGTTQIAEIRKNAFGVLSGFLEKIVVKTRGLLQPCTGYYTQFWHTLAKQRTKTADSRQKTRIMMILYFCPQKSSQTHGQKQLKNALKNVLHTRYTWGQNTQDFLQISATYTFLKKVLTSATF